jgi:hypothetical protein
MKARSPILNFFRADRFFLFNRELQPNISQGELLPNQRYLTQDVINRLFASDDYRRSQFTSFLETGAVGVGHSTNDVWKSYAWMTAPGVTPPHIPRRFSKWTVNWIFFCRTAESEQGKGLFKENLRTLFGLACGVSSAGVFIDTRIDNPMAAKAILAAGFKPAGVLRTWNCYPFSKFCGPFGIVSAKGKAKCDEAIIR